MIGSGNPVTPLLSEPAPSAPAGTETKPLPNTCKACTTCPYGGPKVGSRGRADARIVFVGEAPGVQEIGKGVPLCGPSGSLFWGTIPKAITDWGFKQEDFLILNAMQCRPPESDNQRENQSFKDRGQHACNKRLLDEIKAYPRDLIIAMGNTAFRSITGVADSKITQIRGRLFATPYASIGILATLHPAALLRGTGNYRQYRRDIEYAIDLARGLPPLKSITPTWEVCKTDDQVLAAAWDLWAAKYSAHDVETTGFNRIRDDLLSWGFACRPHHVYIFEGDVAPLLRNPVATRTGRMVWHNGKYDLSFVRKDMDDQAYCTGKGRYWVYDGAGVPEAHVDEDTMLLSYAWDEQGGIHDLEQLSGDLLGSPIWKSALKPYLNKKRNNCYDDVPKEVLYKYQAYDISDTLQDFYVLRPKIAADPGLERLYTKVLIPASETLWWVEQRGIKVCLNRVERNSKRLEAEITKARDAFNKIAIPLMGREINPNYAADVSILLWDVLKFTPKVKGERGTGKMVIKTMPNKAEKNHPVILALQEYRKAVKAKGTYVDRVLKMMDSDGRLRDSYKIHGTRTGRLASSILLLMPRDLHIRGQFEAGPGRRFVKTDLNQAELRSLAAMSRCPVLSKVYQDPNSPSIHDITSEKAFPGVYSVCKDKIAKNEMKMIGKNINFGIVYGISEFGLSDQTLRSFEDCRKWIDGWHATFPGASAFIKMCRSAPIKNQNLVTPFGRKKRHHIVSRENVHDLMNEASNFPHQSCASDITLTSAIEAAPVLRKRDCWIVNIVHDEILIDCPDDEATISWASDYIVEVMERKPREWGITHVPFKAEPNVGKRWGIYRDEKQIEAWRAAQNVNAKPEAVVA